MAIFHPKTHEVQIVWGPNWPRTRRGIPKDLFRCHLIIDDNTVDAYMLEEELKALERAGVKVRIETGAIYKRTIE